MHNEDYLTSWGANLLRYQDLLVRHMADVMQVEKDLKHTK